MWKRLVHGLNQSSLKLWKLDNKDGLSSEGFGMVLWIFRPAGKVGSFPPKPCRHLPDQGMGREKGSAKYCSGSNYRKPKGGQGEKSPVPFYFPFPAEVCIIFGQTLCESWHRMPVAPGQTYKAGCTRTRATSSPSAFPPSWELGWQKIARSVQLSPNLFPPF